MRIVSIEPTPSPLSMKLTVDEALPSGVRMTYYPVKADEAPEPLNRLLRIEGVSSLYRAADFIALDRMPGGRWQSILAEARSILGTADGAALAGSDDLDHAKEDESDRYGEIQVLLQHFRGIPIQVRVSNRAGESDRAALPERFSDAAVRAAAAAPNLIKERTLTEWDTRYGSLQDVLEEIVQEIDASYDDERLSQLIAQAAENPVSNTVTAGELAASARTSLSYEETERLLQDADWRKRYAALQQIEPSDETLPLLLTALGDSRPAVRRLAAVYIGDVKKPEVLPHLYQALKDPNPAVRRTAGDTLSDIGDASAQDAMAEALIDSNKLVRWRAARFLYEFGNERVLDALKLSKEDPEFEVRMQVLMAIERIEGGGAAEGSVWQQMTNRDLS